MKLMKNIKTNKMKQIVKITFLSFCVLIFSNTKAQNYSTAAEVISSGGGETSGGNYTNFGVFGESIVNSEVTGGNYISRIGFLYTTDIITGIKTEIPKNDNIAIYPNPSTGILNFSGENLEKTKIEIYNMLGKMVYKDGYKNTLSISTFPNGLYLIRVKDEKGSIIMTEKIVKE